MLHARRVFGKNFDLGLACLAVSDRGTLRRSLCGLFCSITLTGRFDFTYTYR